MSNIIPFDRGIEQLRQLLDRWRAANEEWIAATLELADALWTARQLHPSNLAFSVWLVENELDDLGRNDRAALTNLGKHLELAKRVLVETQYRSVELIWTEVIQPLVRSASSDQSEDASIKSQFLNPPETAPIPAIPEDAAAKTEAPKQDDAAETHIVRVSRKHPFYGQPRAVEVATIYSNPGTRWLVGAALERRGGSDLWRLILETLDAGLLQRTNIHIQKGRLGLNLLFPEVSRTYAKRFDLTQPKDRALVRERVFPAVLANRDAVMADPEGLERIVDTYHRERDEQQKRERAAALLAKQLSEMPSNQQEIVMYGVRLWPRPEGQYYSYDDLRYGLWSFQDLDRWIDKGSLPGSRGNMMRHIVARLQKFAKLYTENATRERIEGYCAVIRELSRLMAQAPKGECRFPPSPKSEDEE